MRVAHLLPLYVCVAALNLFASPIKFTLTQSGPQLFHYEYFMNGNPLLTNQELDIRFDPTRFGAISNATAGPGFSLIPCCQPNNPPGTFGDYIVVALQDVLVATGSFGVDVVMLDLSTPGIQPYFINQLDANGHLLYGITAGFTEDPPANAPEPGTFGLLAMGLAGACATFAIHRHLCKRSN